VIYKYFVRTHLEYCVHSWNPHFTRDEEVLEKGPEMGNEVC